jgi:membrane protein DedA with SNARE-associated domain
MLQPGERVVANIIGIFGWGIFFTYVGAFLSGVIAEVVSGRSA